MPTIHWALSRRNPKTGNVPTAWIGATREESRQSCGDCPLLHGRCYAQCGRVAMAHTRLLEGVRRKGDKTYSLEAALAHRPRRARMARLSAIGEPAALGTGAVARIARTVRAAGLALVGYTHQWRPRPGLRRYLLASCETLEQVDRALAKGWRAAVVLPREHDVNAVVYTPAGHRVVVCPAVRTDGHIQCNDCRACDASRPGPVIGFPEHGPRARCRR